MGRLRQVVIDCEKPSSLARFWAAALDDFDVRAYDDEEIARLAALGFTPETDPGVIIDGPHLEICFQKPVPAQVDGDEEPVRSPANTMSSVLRRRSWSQPPVNAPWQVLPSRAITSSRRTSGPIAPTR